MASEKRWGAIVAVLGLSAIVIATLIPLEASRVQLPRWCVVCGALGGVDVTLNVLLFVPFGVGLHWSGVPALLAMAVIGATTLAIETLQMSIIAGRDAGLGDLLANSLGGWLGMVLAARRRWWLAPSPRHAWRLMLGGLCLFLSILVATGWALQLSLPQTTYWGQWAPDLAHLEQFEGKVLAASADGVPLPQYRLADSDGVRARLLRDGAQVEALAVPGPPTVDVAPVVSVFDEHQTEIFLLGQDGRDLVFRIRTRAADARLNQPAVRLENAFPDVATADTLRIGGARRAGSLIASIRGDRRGATAAVALSPSLGWALFSPFDHAMGREAHLYSAMWLALLLAPIGFWGARATGRTEPLGAQAVRTASALRTSFRTVLLLCAVTAGGLQLVSALFGFPAANWLEWLGGLVGMGIGWAGGRVSSRSTRNGSRPNAG